jgi:hypothetical protein
MSDDNRKFRPPHMAFKIRELIKLGKCDEAQCCTDENVAFYDDKIAEQQDLFIEAQMAKMGLKPTADNKLATTVNMPKRRVPTSRTYGQGVHRA